MKQEHEYSYHRCKTGAREKLANTAVYIKLSLEAVEDADR